MVQWLIQLTSSSDGEQVPEHLPGMLLQWIENVKCILSNNDVNVYLHVKHQSSHSQNYSVYSGLLSLFYHTFTTTTGHFPVFDFAQWREQFQNHTQHLNTQPTPTLEKNETVDGLTHQFQVFFNADTQQATLRHIHHHSTTDYNLMNLYYSIRIFQSVLHSGGQGWPAVDEPSTTVCQQRPLIRYNTEFGYL